MSQATPLPLRVVAAEALGPTLKRFTFAAADGSILPTSAPGAHILLTLEAAGRTHRNAYSLVSDPRRRDRYEIICRRVRDGRGGADFMHTALQPGALLQAAWPANLFPLPSRARKHLLISGGIGVTPLLAYLPVLQATGARFELHHLCHADERETFAALLAPFAADNVTIHPGRASLDLSAVLARQKLGTHLSICGPRALMDAGIDQARALGWPAASLHREVFGAPAGGAPLRVTAARAGRAIDVAGDQTILEALEAAGLAPASLCRGGACGACATAVLDGEPDHRDDFLTDAEKLTGRTMMICVSRARTPALVLDI